MEIERQLTFLICDDHHVRSPQLIARPPRHGKGLCLLAFGQAAAGESMHVAVAVIARHISSVMVWISCSFLRALCGACGRARLAAAFSASSFLILFLLLSSSSSSSSSSSLLVFYC